MVEYMKKAGAEIILMSENGKRPKNFFLLVKKLFRGFKKALKEVSAGDDRRRLHYWNSNSWYEIDPNTTSVPWVH
jgi:hypothetical protein